MTRIIRTTIKPQTNSGGRSSWLKFVTSVDTAKKDGYAFEGEFLKLDQEIELPIGAIVIEKKPTGSVKTNGHQGNIYEVVETPIKDVRNPHLQLIEYCDWHREFLTFRDRVAELVRAREEAREARINLMVKPLIEQAQANRSTEQIKINELNEAIDLVLRAKRLTEGMGSPHQTICNCAESLIQVLDIYRKSPAELLSSAGGDQ
jgi:hypothetical protein